MNNRLNNYTFLFPMILIFLLLASTVNVQANDGPNISSPQALLYNLSKDEVIFESNSDEKIPIENLSILMTTVLFLDELKTNGDELTKRIELTDNVWNNGGINMFLEPQHKPTLEDILNGLTVVSGNDAAIAAAEYVGGNLDNFVTMMNNKADSLSMNDTIFVSANGSTRDISTSLDLSKLVIYLIEEHNDYFSYFSKEFINYEPSTSNQKYELNNQNSFFRNNSGVTGLKSGWGERYHLITTATIEGMDFLIINLGEASSTDRNNNARELMNYATNAYDIVNLGSKGDTYLNYYVYKSDSNGPDPVVYKDDLAVYIKKGLNTDELTYQYTGEDYLLGGLNEGDTVGNLVVSYEGKVLAETDIVTTENYPKASFFSSIFDSIALFFSYTLMDWVGAFFN